MHLHARMRAFTERVHMSVMPRDQLHDSLLMPARMYSNPSLH
jgi:hypothetical protein